jgi:hypothetical protein
LWEQSKEAGFELKQSAFGAEASAKCVPGRNNSNAALSSGFIEGV